MTLNETTHLINIYLENVENESFYYRLSGPSPTWWDQPTTAVIQSLFQLGGRIPDLTWLFYILSKLYNSEYI